MKTMMQEGEAMVKLYRLFEDAHSQAQALLGCEVYLRKQFYFFIFFSPFALTQVNKGVFFANFGFIF